MSCQLGEVALEQWAPWGRPPFGALMQLCFSTARGLPVAIAYLLSNRAEKPVCAPGPCCTLEFAVPSRPDGQQPKLMYAASPCRMDGLARSPGGCDWSQLVRLCSRCREVVPMHVGALCGGRADRHRAEGCGWRVARHGEGAVEQYERKACNNHMSRTARPRTPYPGCCTPSPERHS